MCYIYVCNTRSSIFLIWSMLLVLASQVLTVFTNVLEQLRKVMEVSQNGGTISLKHPRMFKQLHAKPLAFQKLVLQNASLQNWPTCLSLNKSAVVLNRFFHPIYKCLQVQYILYRARCQTKYICSAFPIGLIFPVKSFFTS